MNNVQSSNKEAEWGQDRFAKKKLVVNLTRIYKKDKILKRLILNPINKCSCSYTCCWIFMSPLRIIRDHTSIILYIGKMYLICTVYRIGKFFNRNCSKLIWQKNLFLGLFSSIGAITVNDRLSLHNAMHFKLPDICVFTHGAQQRNITWLSSDKSIRKTTYSTSPGRPGENGNTCKEYDVSFQTVWSTF